ncbi:MAG: YceI family protein [Cytophagales bacterium]|nr:YceI family protein [Cytophagales bacterium]
MKTTFLFVLALMSVPFFWSQQSQWRVEDDYVVKFSGTGAEGTFRNLSGSIVFDPADLGSSKFDVAVDANTISTGNKTKDKHARGDSWFDTDNYPKIRFVSSNITRSKTGYQVTGTLELHGVQKEVEIPFTFDPQGGSGVFEGSFTVDRKEYEINGPFFGFMVGDEFEIMLKVPVRQ